MIELYDGGKILSDSGELLAVGYSKKNIFDYNAEEINAHKFRIKEWDFYQITSDEFMMQMTIGHVGYMANLNVTVVEFLTGHRIVIERMIPLKSLKLERNAESKHFLQFSHKGMEMSFDVRKNTRRLQMKCVDKRYGACEVDITLLDKGENGIVLLKPFEKKNQFYFNEKLNCMPTSGFARFGQSYFSFNASKNFALLDWGRGVLPFRHTWIWGSGSGLIGKDSFGFNIGQFNDDESATENILYFKGKSYKLGKLNFEYSEENYMGKWRVFSDEENFILEMTPMYDNHTKTKKLFVDNNCHQVFGKFSGHVMVEKEKIEVVDFFGFIEKANNKW